MADVQRSLTDGVSTGSGSPVPAWRRAPPGQRLRRAFVTPAGTLVLGAHAARSLARPAIARPGSRPACPARQACCGDGWRWATRTGDVSLLVCDGLGHGPDAAAATQAALAAFPVPRSPPCPPCWPQLHQPCRARVAAPCSPAAAACGRLRAALRRRGQILGRAMSGIFERGLVTPHGTAACRCAVPKPPRWSCPGMRCAAAHRRRGLALAGRALGGPAARATPTLLAAALAWTQARGPRRHHRGGAETRGSCVRRTRPHPLPRHARRGRRCRAAGPPGAKPRRGRVPAHRAGGDQPRCVVASLCRAGPAGRAAQAGHRAQEPLSSYMSHEFRAPIGHPQHHAMLLDRVDGPLTP